MCEINPTQKKFFRLEVFTSDRNITKHDFEYEISELLLKAEMKLNESGKFRFHIHPMEE